MAGSRGKPGRREEILQALALMLETRDGERITTAGLARQVGFSEAALYKHFPSKAKMYEGLLDFADEALFSRINIIAAEDMPAARACGDTLLVTLTFAERNPGITRMLCGDALHGEHERLRNRAGRFFQRLQSELSQLIKRGEVRELLKTSIPPGPAATLMVNVVEGRLHQFVRSAFTECPTAGWEMIWPVMASSLFQD